MAVAEDAETSDASSASGIEDVNQIPGLSHRCGHAAAGGDGVKKGKLGAVHGEYRQRAAARIYSEEQMVVRAQRERALRVQRIDSASTAVAAGRKCPENSRDPSSWRL